MNKPKDIRYKNIKDYILDKCNVEELDKIKKLQNDNPTLAHLISIVDELKHKSKSNKNNITRDIPESFSEIDSIIFKILSGRCDDSFSQNFLSWLTKSASFFEKFYTKLDQVSSIQSDTELPELQEVAIKKDDELLQQAGILRAQPEKEKHSIFEWIKGLIAIIITWFQVKPKLAYSVLSLLIISISSPFGIRFYNTSYQLILAQNLLQENYHIYMSDTPRLSGGYAATGISMLMSDEKQKDSYLDHALEKIIIADNYDSELPDAKQLQAQIFFINKQYAKADSVLILIDKNDRNSASILNDQGVIKFALGEIQKSTHFFESTINSYPNFSEAYYNLALVKLKIGKKDESITLLNQFLKIEKDEGWKNAALNLMNELKK